MWAAPGRINLVGEHTDYNEGRVLPVALERSTRVAAAPREDGELRLESLDLPGEADGEAYVRGMASALGASAGADLLVTSSVPIGAGLASSAALCVAAGAALLGLEGREVAPLALARAAQAAEAAAGAPVGIMDPLVAVLGRRGEAVLIDCRSLAAERLPFDPGAAGLVLLVVDTGVRHAVAGGGYARRRSECAAAAAALGVRALRDATPADVERLDDPVLRARARHVVAEDARVLTAAAHLRAGESARLGPLLSASHASLRDDFEVSVPELDAVVAAAEAAGALGARMTGAGFGGCAIALVPLDREAAVREAVGRALPAAETFAAVPGDGARRVR